MFSGKLTFDVFKSELLIFPKNSISHLCEGSVNPCALVINYSLILNLFHYYLHIQ